MDVRIGISDINRELQLRTKETADEVLGSLRKALTDGSLFEMTDEKGRRILVPAAKVAYLDLGPADTRPVGFGTL
ncbi:DUF3107 domain-containing protein [Arachnia propionica]|uniref:DUF3107 domain-containing protein n=1 Tax=Arachnia propionica TaxID=1750 RepID=A0A3P1X093_9ACTN|nr:DUF3107 domain-containing protein [Arachnia propionica]RRD51110.1 DUF3107 domain-containing protein [Arachnia propionica]